MFGVVSKCYKNITMVMSFREKTSTQRSSQSQRFSQSLSQDTRIDTLSEATNLQSGISVQDLLLDAYSWIGDPDGVYGCGAGRKADASSRFLKKFFIFIQFQS